MIKTVFPACAYVFVSGFAVMVLEIIGARYLAVDFGSSFYVWTSQIGVILLALALGYSIGGAAADRFRRAAALSLVLAPAGVFTFLIPKFAPALLDQIVMRHPLDAPIPNLWQKLDPMLGSACIFFPPCFALAMVSPYMIRLAARQLDDVGRISGAVFAAGTAGSILGVFVSGYVLIDLFGLTRIFQIAGILIVLLGLTAPGMDACFKKNSEDHADEADATDL